MENNDFINNNNISNKYSTSINTRKVIYKDEDTNTIKDLNNEINKLRREINNNKTLIEKLKQDKDKYEKEIKKLNEQIRSKTSSNNNNISVYASKATTSIVEKYKQRNYSNNKDYINDKNERELKNLQDKVSRLQDEVNNNKKLIMKKYII